MMEMKDADYALHEIRQMIIIARRSMESPKPSNDPAYLLVPAWEVETLRFSIADILNRVDALTDELATAQPATAAPHAESDSRVAKATEQPDAEFHRRIEMENFICEAVHMAQIADALVDDVDRDDEDSRGQLSFQVGHTRQLLEDLRRRYYEKDWTLPHEQQG
jgi:hypothetical protein